MTDKIKEAREDTQYRISSLTSMRAGFLAAKHYIDNRLEILKTILEALSAYEKLQGVDGMKKKICDKDPIECWRIVCHMPRDCADKKFNMGYNQAIKDIKAQLVADIGGK